MNKLGAVNQNFTSKKLDGYDRKRMEKIAVNLAVGDVKSAKQGAIEYMEDKESDTFRHILTMLIATGAAIAAGRKLGKPIVKNLSVAGDIVCDWFKKNACEGSKTVTKFFKKEIGEGNIKDIVGKVIKDEEYLQKATDGIMAKLNKMIKLDEKETMQLKHVAEIGLGGIASYVLGGGVNKITDIVDDKTDAKRQYNADKEYDLKTEWKDFIGE